jgi:plasmid segregation protein ParM
MKDGQLITGSFPSVATPVLQSALMTEAAGIGIREADIRVNIDGIQFQVDTQGTDVVESSVTRSENDDFPITDEHLAIAFAAMVRCEFRHVDHVVVGLPLLTFHQHATNVAKKLEGVHDFGYGRFTVNKVSVLPQPMGAYVALRKNNPAAFLTDTSIGIIDCGWGTTDVLVASPKFKVDWRRCGGFSGGAAIVLRKIAELLQRDHKGRFTNIDRIDRAIMLGKPLQHYGEAIDLEPYLQEALQVTTPIARSVLNTLRTPEDLTIFAAGGAANYYLPALRKILGCEVKLLDQPRFANAVGFWHAGMEACRVR